MTVHQVRRAPRTTVDLMRDTAQAHPDREAFVDGDRRMTFSEWDRAAEGVAGAWSDAGVGKGDVVCLRLPSGAAYAVAYQAAMRLGAVTSGINPRLGPAEVESIRRRTSPGLTIGHPDEVWALTGSGLPVPRPALSPSDPVAIVWTSGTTGHPKGAVFDHENLEAVARGAGALSALGDRRLSPLPFAHVGFMTRVWDELFHVVTTVVTPSPWKAGDAVALLATEGVTVAQGVPTQWALVVDHPALAEVDLSSLRLAATGGSSVSPALVRKMRDRLGCVVLVRYTSTEASLTTGTGVEDPDHVVANTVGRPNEGVEVRLEDGEVLVRSKAVMRGYWRDPDATAAALSPEGWLRTGDLGRLDGDGNLVLLGRLGDMYIRGGYNVYPAEVEGALADHPAVEKAAVVGLPDPVLGERGVAYVVARPGARTVTTDELRSWCRSRLADYKAPDVVHLVEDLPLTAMHKVDKRALVQR